MLYDLALEHATYMGNKGKASHDNQDERCEYIESQDSSYIYCGEIVSWSLHEDGNDLIDENMDPYTA